MKQYTKLSLIGGTMNDAEKSNETSSCKENLSEMRKLDPDLVEVFLQIKPKVDTPKSLDTKIHKMCMAHKNKYKI